jgi:hypothetical protein
VLLLPVDVSNVRGNSGLDMYTGWVVIYISVFAMTVVVIPFAIFFYESDEDKPFVLFYSIIISFKDYACLYFKNL